MNISNYTIFLDFDRLITDLIFFTFSNEIKITILDIFKFIKKLIFYKLKFFQSFSSR